MTHILTLIYMAITAPGGGGGAAVQGGTSGAGARGEVIVYVI